MPLVIVAFLAGVLTVLAPCVLPLLPVVLTGSVVPGSKSSKRPLVIIASLAASIIVFSLLLKGTTVLLGVPQQVWQSVSGLTVVVFGLHYLFPAIWDRISVTSGISRQTGALLGSATHSEGWWGTILLGVALGPVFNSCSPTYALIVAAILPVSFSRGVVYLIAYVLGLSLVLLLIAWLGRSLVSRLGWAVNERGWFRSTIGVILVIVGLAVMTGLDKKVQTFVLEKGWYDPIGNIESRAL